MDVSLDNRPRGNKTPQTCIYAPSDKSSSEIRLQAEDDTPLRPQPLRFNADANEPEEEAAQIEKPKKDRPPVLSYVLLVVSVFIIAATAILAINGNATVAKVYSKIYVLDDEIKDYQEKISMLRKEQSSLNDYNTISNANRNAGRIMTWEEGSTTPIGN